MGDRVRVSCRDGVLGLGTKYRHVDKLQRLFEVRFLHHLVFHTLHPATFLGTVDAELLLFRRMPFNADVLEVIAEYACATVEDACALRAACKGYRRAVDTTVRRLVYAAQPEVRRSSAADGGQRPLYIDRDDAGLDAVRIALTCDAFVAIVRLVFVAFALDGAKDEAHEAAECGPRPVTIPEMNLLQALLPAPADLSVKRSNPPAREPCRPPARIGVALQGCATHARRHKLNASLFNDGTLWPRLVSLHWHAAPADASSAGTRRRARQATDDAQSVELLGQFIAAVSPRLTELALCLGPLDGRSVARALPPAIVRCTRLRKLKLSGRNVRGPESRAICEALIASGAPLEEVCPTPFDQTECLRLLEACPTIHTVLHHPLTSVPHHIAQRLRALNSVAVASPAAVVQTINASAGWFPSERVTEIRISTSVGLLEPLPPSFLGLLDFSSAYPSLMTLRIDSVMVDLSCARFPPTLEDLYVNCASAASTNGIFGQLGSHGSAGLPRLRAVTAKVSTGPAEVDVGPLVAFSSTLARLSLCVSEYFDTEPYAPMDADCVRLEAALSRLTALVHARVPALPTAHCFLAGRHLRLRVLAIGGPLHAPVASRTTATFPALVQACPRLVEAHGGGNRGRDVALPEGWMDASPRASGRSYKRVAFATDV